VTVNGVLEIAYTIEDKTPFRKGAEGLWSFARREPAVVSQFTLGRPANNKINVFVSEGIDEPEEQVRKNPDMNIYTWKTGPLEDLGRPFTDDVAAYTPHITWSVWNNWTVLGGYVSNAVSYGMNLDETLKNKLDSLKESTRTVGELAGNIADFIKNTTTYIRKLMLLLTVTVWIELFWRRPCLKRPEYPCNRSFWETVTVR